MTNTASVSKKRNPPDSISTQSKRPRHPPSDSVPPAANITIPTPSADQLRAENAYEHRKIAETCLNGNGRWALGSHCEGMLRDEGVEIPASQLGLSVDRFSFSSVDPGAATPTHESDDDDDETCDSSQDNPIPIPQPARPATILRKPAAAPPLPPRRERLSLEESQRVLREGFEQERARLVQTSMPDSEDFRNVRIHDVAVPSRVPCSRRASLADKIPAAERLRSREKPRASPVIAAPSAKDATAPAGVVPSQTVQIARTPRDKENIVPGADDSAVQSTPVAKGKGKAVDRPASAAGKQVTSFATPAKKTDKQVKTPTAEKQSDGQAKTPAKAPNTTTTMPATVWGLDSQGGQQQVVLATVMAQPQKESSLQGASAQTHELRKSDESFGNLREVARVQAQGQSQTQVQPQVQPQAQSQSQVQAQAQAQSQVQSQPRPRPQAQVPIQAQAQTRVQAQPPAQSQPQTQPQLHAKGQDQAQPQLQAQPQVQGQPQPHPQAKGKAKAQPPAQASQAKQTTPKAKPPAKPKTKKQTKTQIEQAAGPAPTGSVTPETLLQLPPSLPNVSVGIDGRVTGESQFLQIPQMQMQMQMHALPQEQQPQQQDLGQNQSQIQGVIMDQTQAPAPTHAIGASQGYLPGDVQTYGLDPMQQQIYEQVYANPYEQVHMQPQQMQPWFEQPQAIPAHFLQQQLDLQLEPQLQPALLSLGLPYAPQDAYSLAATPQQPPPLLTPPLLTPPHLLQPQLQPHTDYSADLILQQNQLISRLQRLVDYYENEAEERAERCRHMHQLMHARPEADEHAQTAQAQAPPPQPPQPQPEDQQPGPTQPARPTASTLARPLAPVIVTETPSARSAAATLPGFLQGASAAVQVEFHAEQQQRGSGAGTPASVPSATTAESSGASSSVGTGVAGPATREMQALQLDSRPGSVGGKAQAQVQAQGNQFRWVHWEGPPGK
uniref:Uncharacterized protein n=1 Tax=Thielaviopsis paradoxa TaxID=13001 RepID=A0A2R4ZLF6_9PEZI|nr:TPA_exp: hypothetical protein [Thielaviopsis paradoxa]